MALHRYDNVVQGSQEWLDLRRGKVTCSNALTVMNRGLNACLKANDEAALRLTPNGNAYAERGHVVEHEYKEEFNEVLLSDQGLKLEECGFITNDKYPNAGYSPDGLIIEEATGDLVSFAEFKAYNDITRDERTGKLRLSCKHRNACRDKLLVPPECIAQCNMAMLITETEYMYLFLCNPDAKKTNDYIINLLHEIDTGHGTPEIVNQLKKAVPDGDYGWKVPATKIWLIERDQKICDRIISGLSR